MHYACYDECINTVNYNYVHAYNEMCHLSRGERDWESESGFK